MTENGSPKKVVYLIGAGASHGSVKYAKSARGILMKDLAPTLANKVHELIQSEAEKYDSLGTLANEVIVEDVDVEHVITFLDESPSFIHRQFADELRLTFQTILRSQLDTIKEEIGDNRFSLYAALLDMYQVVNCPEELHAILTINYDEYIEDAAASIERPVDFGIRLQEHDVSPKSLKLLKLHGSFGWKDTWPIPKVENLNTEPLWIPPGILKGKQQYPFNVLWGLARELLDCDILRIIGCQLSPNDWDLISLLFTTRHTHTSRSSPFVVEVIDSPVHAIELKRLYPYLDIRSLLEIKIKKMEIGNQLVGRFTNGPPQAFDSLTSKQLKDMYDRIKPDENWFHTWLKQMAESFASEPGVGVETPKGEFEKLLENY